MVDDGANEDAIKAKNIEAALKLIEAVEKDDKESCGDILNNYPDCKDIHIDKWVSVVVLHYSCHIFESCATYI